MLNNMIMKYIKQGKMEISYRVMENNCWLRPKTATRSICLSQEFSVVAAFTQWLGLNTVCVIPCNASSMHCQKAYDESMW